MVATAERPLASTSAAEVLKWLQQVKGMNSSQILNSDGTLRPLDEWPDVWVESLSGLDVQEVYAGQNDAEAARTFLRDFRWPDMRKVDQLISRHRRTKEISSGTHTQATKIRP
jgi:phage terminase small subunit